MANDMDIFSWIAWLKAAQGLLSASLFCALLALVVTVIWAFKGPKKATCIAACVLYILAGIVHQSLVHPASK